VGVMAGYSNKEAWTFFRNLVASDRVDNVPFDKSPLGETTGNPFFDAKLTHSEAVTIDTARMFATIASFMLENASMSSACEPMLDKSDLMDLIFTANEHELLIREGAAEREAAKTKVNLPTPIVLPSEGDEAQTFPSKKNSDEAPPRSPGGVMDFRAQAQTGMYAWLGVLGGLGVHLIASVTTHDNFQEVIQIALPKPIEGFESLESILKRQRLSEGIANLTWDFFPWMAKYYLAYAKKLPKKTFLIAAGALLAIFTVVYKMAYSTMDSELLMLFAMNHDRATRTQADSELISIVNACGQSGESSRAHGALKDLVSARTMTWINKRELNTADYKIYAQALDALEAVLDRKVPWIQSKGKQKKEDTDDFILKALGQGGKMTELMHRIPKLFTAENVKSMIGDAVETAFGSSTESKKEMIKFATTAREFGEDANYCLREAANSSLAAVKLVGQASDAAEGFRLSSEDPFNAAGVTLGGVIILFLLGHVVNSCLKRAAAQEAMIKAYGLFLMNRNKLNPKEGIAMSNVDNVAEQLENCIETLYSKNLIVRAVYDAWNTTRMQQMSVIKIQSEKIAVQIDNPSLTDKTQLYKNLALSCSSAMTKLVNLQDEVDDKIKEYLESQDIPITDKPLCDQLLKPRKAAPSPRPATPVRGGGRRPARSPARTRGNADGNASDSLVDQIVDRFYAELRG